MVKQWSRLGSASGITSISERLLERLRKHFGGVNVSPLKSRPCQVSVADDHALKARYQTTDDLQVSLQAPHGRIRFRVAFVILPGSDDVMIICSKTLRESLDNIDVVQALHQRVSEIGELFADPDSAARADESVRSLRRVSGPGLPVARREALVGALRVAVQIGLPEGCVVELEEIVLGECFNAF